MKGQNMWMIVVVIALVGIDQLVKFWASTTLQAIGSIPLWEGVFHLTYVENRGMAFSLLQGQRWFFIVTTLVVLAGIVYAVKTKLVQTKLGEIALVLCASGAIGNFIDRLCYGYVVDMLDFCLIDFPVFNVADICVVCAAILFFYYIAFQHKDELEPSNKQKTGE